MSGPTWEQRKSWNNDGMDPDWRPYEIEKDFWNAPFYDVTVIQKIELAGQETLDTPNNETKRYLKKTCEIHSILVKADPLKAYLEGVKDLIRGCDIYEQRVNVVGFKGRSIIVEAYVHEGRNQ